VFPAEFFGMVVSMVSYDKKRCQYDTGDPKTMRTAIVARSISIGLALMLHMFTPTGWRSSIVGPDVMISWARHTARQVSKHRDEAKIRVQDLSGKK
jgi:hypothetical protein